MQNIRDKIKRKLSMNDKNPNLDDANEGSDHEFDEETTGTLHKDIQKAEEEDHPQGKPGSYLNKLITHGNKKTEDQMQREQLSAANAK